MKGEYHHVGMEEAKRVAYPDKLDTLGVASCLGIGILNKKERIGYLGHYCGCDGDFTSLIDQAVREAGKISDLEVAVVGLTRATEEECKRFGADFKVYLEMEREDMELLMAALKSKGIKKKNIRTYFSKKAVENYSYSIFIDTETCTMKVKLE